jgi:predicted transcriptional regulator
MGRTKSSRPTDAELAILTVLWKRPRTSIRDISIALDKLKPTTYATTQTLVRIMEKKGLVRRGPERYPAFYYPSSSEAVAKKALVRDFAQRAFGGSFKKLLLSTLAATKKGNGKQAVEIRKLIEQLRD